MSKFKEAEAIFEKLQYLQASNYTNTKELELILCNCKSVLAL